MQFGMFWLGMFDLWNYHLNQDNEQIHQAQVSHAQDQTLLSFRPTAAGRCPDGECFASL